MSTNQSKSKAGRDLVGRDKVTIQQTLITRGSIETLLLRLKEQIENDERAIDTIVELSRYSFRHSDDGVDGLEAKLEKAGKSSIYLDAIEKKEHFAKLLERYSLYSSAQRIFAVFLARVETEFNYVIYPNIEDLEDSELNAQIIDRIVKPICEEVDCTIIHIDFNTVFGMVYWLAELCFIRWHK